MKRINLNRFVLKPQTFMECLIYVSGSCKGLRRTRWSIIGLINVINDYNWPKEINHHCKNYILDPIITPSIFFFNHIRVTIILIASNGDMHLKSVPDSHFLNNIFLAFKIRFQFQPF